MPIFEYKCNDCNTMFEVLHKSKENKDNVFCPKCKSVNHKKLLSTFSSPGVSSDSGFDAGCSTGACDMPSYGGGCPGGMCGLN